jgi:NADH dehydrogenase FAD-containing subunit
MAVDMRHEELPRWLRTAPADLIPEPSWLRDREVTAAHARQIMANMVAALADYERAAGRPRGVWVATGRPVTAAQKRAIWDHYERLKAAHEARQAATAVFASASGSSPFVQRIFGLGGGR